MDDDAQQQPLRVHCDLAFASHDLLGGVIAARAAGLRRFHALAVDDGCRRAWLPPCHVAQQNHKVIAHALPHARANEGAEVAIHGRLGQERRRRRRRQVLPLAARPQQVEQAVQQAPHVGRPRTTAGLGGWDQWLHQPPLIVAQPLTRPVITNQRTVFRRPHRRPYDSQTVWNAATTPRSDRHADVSDLRKRGLKRQDRCPR